MQAAATLTDGGNVSGLWITYAILAAAAGGVGVAIINWLRGHDGDKAQTAATEAQTEETTVGIATSLLKEVRASQNALEKEARRLRDENTRLTGENVRLRNQVAELQQQANDQDAAINRLNLKVASLEAKA